MGDSQVESEAAGVGLTSYSYGYNSLLGPNSQVFLLGRPSASGTGVRVALGNLNTNVIGIRSTVEIDANPTDTNALWLPTGNADFRRRFYCSRWCGHHQRQPRGHVGIHHGRCQRQGSGERKRFRAYRLHFLANHHCPWLYARNQFVAGGFQFHWRHRCPRAGPSSSSPTTGQALPGRMRRRAGARRPISSP